MVVWEGTQSHKESILLTGGRFGGTQSLQESILVGRTRRQCRRVRPTKGDFGEAKPPRTPPVRKCWICKVQQYGRDASGSRDSACAAGDHDWPPASW